jgi:hypothetical protein
MSQTDISQTDISTLTSITEHDSEKIKLNEKDRACAPISHTANQFIQELDHGTLQLFIDNTHPEDDTQANRIIQQLDRFIQPLSSDDRESVKQYIHKRVNEWQLVSKEAKRIRTGQW